MSGSDADPPSGPGSEIVIRTSRLVLREWRDDDIEPFAAMNSDPKVMEYFPSSLSRTESDAFAASIRARFAESGWGLFAVEVTGVKEFAGFVGLSELGPHEPFEFAPAVEIGWRLALDAWGHGYATEAALAVLGLAFGELGLSEVVSFTAAVNLRSRAVMERLAMRHDTSGDFEHPRVRKGHLLSPHVLYRVTPEDLATSSDFTTRALPVTL